MLHHLDQLIGAFEAGNLTRRQLVSRIGAVMAAGIAASRVTAQDDDNGAKPTFKVKELNHIALNVKDVARSRDWYKKHLGLTVMSDSEHSCFMRCGPHFLALFKEGESGMDHYCYTIDDYRPDAVMEKLKAAGLEPRRHGNRVYFDDPDGLTVQLAARND